VSDDAEDQAAPRGQRTLLGLAFGAPVAMIRAVVRVEQQGQKMLMPALSGPSAVEEDAQHPSRDRSRSKRPREGGASMVLDALLERALLQSSADAEDALAAAVLLQLVPDEARMLSALARSGWDVAVDITPRGGRAEGNLEGASLLGRHAAVALVECTSAYLARLRGFGLIDATDERDGHDQEYEILLAEPNVLRALKAGRHAGRGPLVRRYGVVLSPLGELVLRVGGSEALPK
jgi:hypothetical protein